MCTLTHAYTFGAQDPVVREDTRGVADCGSARFRLPSADQLPIKRLPRRSRGECPGIEHARAHAETLYAWMLT